MRFLKHCLPMCIFSLMLHAEEIFIPQPFQDGRVIEQLILISDVDGVVREGIEACGDQRVLIAIKSLLENKNIDVTFISGTPVANDSTLEPWRRGNAPLGAVFGNTFEKELSENRVAIFGVLGGQKMKEDGSLEIVDAYSSDSCFELGRLLLHAFLKEVMHQGNLAQQVLAGHLQAKLDALQMEDYSQPSHATPKEFAEIVCTIREHLDPEFRLINSGALVEIHISNPPWKAMRSSLWLQEEIEKPQYGLSHLPREQKRIAGGYAKKEGEGFNFLLISKTHKGLATKKHIEEKLKKMPNALIVTIGDSQVDFPMHHNAHLAFHVGPELVFRDHFVPQCIMVRGKDGRDSQHVLGTLKVLSLLKEAVGKSFHDFKYIPRQDTSGNWEYYSVKELEHPEM